MTKVLVIDDEEISRRMLKRLLTMAGYETFVADGGEAGLKIFKKENPDIVLVDIEMPGMDGIEVLGEVKKIFAQTEVIVITGHGGMETVIEALRKDAFDYITKPINYDELKITIKRALEKQRLLIENRRMHEETVKQRDELKKRIFEIDVLYNASNAISYTLDYQQLLKLIMESLFKIVDYDICASLLFDAHAVNITLKPVYAQSVGFVDKVKKSLIESVSMLTGENIREKRMDAYLLPSDFGVKPKEERQFDELKSFFNVPFIVGSKTIGMINVSSCKENAFSEGDIKLIYTIANQASSSIERLQEVITAEKSKMESMVESMSEGVLMLDERGDIVVLNPKAREMLGFGGKEEVTSRVLNEKMKTVNLDKVLQECQSKKHLIVKEIIIPGKINIILRCNTSLVINAKKKTIGVVSVLRDITKEKEVDRMKNEFVSTVSHELRTPLAITKEGINLILDEIPGKINKKQDNILTTARDNIDRLARIINNLLDISKIEAGEVTLNRNLVDIDALVDKTISSLKPQADKKNIKFKVSYSPDLSDLYVDQDKVTQVFTNLINNAIKFTIEKGRISVTIKDKDKEVECSVNDTGIGIPGDELDKVFDKFHQLGRVSGAGEKGTGLGLAITKKLIGLHNGRIWVESELGKGSKFTFTLPKIGTEILLREYLNNGMIQAKKQKITMSLMIISLTNFEQMKEKYKTKGIIKILSQIREIVTKIVFSPTNMVNTYHKGETVLVLLKARRRDTLALEKKFKKAINAHQFIIKGKSVKAGVNFGIAVYPEEAQTKDELIKKAKVSLEEREKMRNNNG